MSALVTTEPRNGIDPAVVESVLIKGDLRQLTSAQKVSYYKSVCESIGLNPLTQPFAYIVLNGKEQLYAKKDCTEQLRKIHSISIDPKGFVREVIEGVYIVTATASTPEGRTDVSTGAVAIEGLKGETRANAMMKAETKAKRRVTLSICGLGMLDETETETVHPTLVVEAPKSIAAPERAPLPNGAVYILSVLGKTYGGDIKVIDANGEERDYPVPDRQCSELAEQIAQEGVPAVLTLVTGKRDGRVKVKAVHRWTADEPQKAPEPETIVVNASDIPF